MQLQAAVPRKVTWYSPPLPKSASASHGVIIKRYTIEVDAMVLMYQMPFKIRPSKSMVNLLLGARALKCRNVGRPNIRPKNAWGLIARDVLAMALILNRVVVSKSPSAMDTNGLVMVCGPSS
jgi:hypothetical protein